jgi:hypothetical protein
VAACADSHALRHLDIPVAIHLQAGPSRTKLVRGFSCPTLGDARITTYRSHADLVLLGKYSLLNSIHN